MSRTQHTTNATNGVDVDRLLQTIDAVKESPELARFKFRAETEWLEGARSRTRIKRFRQAGKEVAGRDRPLVLEGDEPDVLLGSDTAPNAVETVLHALTSCLAVGFVYNAAARGIEVESLNFSLDGDLDLRPFLGISQDGRPGYEGIRVSYRVKSDAPRKEIEDLCKYVQDTSPVMDIIRNPVPVQVVLEE
jgi:uncharacterized OsmC-like protein